MAIQNECMLITINFSKWDGWRFDKRASESTTAHYGAEEDAARVNKRLLPKETFMRINAAKNKIVALRDRFTVPWDNNNQRLLASRRYFKFSEELQPMVEEYKEAADELCQKYAVLVSEAVLRLQGLHNPDDYPEESTLRDKFDVTIAVTPVPDAGHLVINIQNGELAKLQEQVTEQVNTQVKIARQRVWTDLHKVVGRMAERLSDDDAVFRDTLVSNVQDIVNLLPELNVENDPAMETMRREVENSLLTYSAKDLRVNDTVRQDTAKAAEEIMVRMAGFMGSG